MQVTNLQYLWLCGCIRTCTQAQTSLCTCSKVPFHGYQAHLETLKDLCTLQSTIDGQMLLTFSPRIHTHIQKQFTGKLNATQIHLLNPSDPPPSEQWRCSDNGDISMAAVMLASKSTGQQDSFRGSQSPVDAWDEALHQLAGRMMSMGFSQAQVGLVLSYNFKMCILVLLVDVV